MSKKNLLKKVTIMSKGQSPKKKESVFNIPICEVDRDYMPLAKPEYSNYLSVVKLKRKAKCCRYDLFEPVRQNVVDSF